MEPGEVRITAWDQRRCRVIAADDMEVLYDAWWPDLGAGLPGWGFHKLTGRLNYYRLPARHLLASSELVGFEPLTERERAVHRPDLPLRAIRRTGWRWTREQFESKEELARATWPRGSCEVSDEVALDAPALVVVPQGPKGGLRRGEKIVADDGRAFGGLELLFKVHQIQARHLREASDGAGLYRHGCERGLPSFYVGGDRDLAGFLDD